jgi:hypothetical protein
MIFQQRQQDFACSKTVQKGKDRTIQQNGDDRVVKMPGFSTTRKSPVSGFQPLFAFSTGYTTTTLLHFMKKGKTDLEEICPAQQKWKFR